MSFRDFRKGLTDTAFATFGEVASWTGASSPVLIRRRTQDDDERLSEAEFRVRTTIIRVRRSDIAQPLAGDEVATDEGRWKIVNAPALDVKGVWQCDAVEIV